MGSSKKPKKRKVEAADAPAAREVAVGRGALLEHSDLASLHASVDDVRRRLDLVERQLERVLLLHDRTNALLELLAGSAFDMELDVPPPS